MSRHDWAAVCLSLIAILASLWIATQVLENIPHIEDEMAYNWQAKVIAHGEVVLQSPYCPRCFLQPFVVDYEGNRFGKYPLGWPTVLAFGVALGIRGWINPLLAGLSVWLTYRLGSKLLGKSTGLVAAMLLAASPFFLMNSATLLSHTWSLVLTLALSLSWLDSQSHESSVPHSITTACAGLALGLLAITRPLTAIGVGIPFFVHGLYILFAGNTQIRWRVVRIGLIAALVTSLQFLWQYAATGNALINLYELWWPYDKVGFGPGVGLNLGGHTISFAWINTKFSLKVGAADLFGWGNISWIFLPIGTLVLALRRNGRALLVSSTGVSLILVYMLYWIGSWLTGPRYYFEALVAATLLSAAGITWLSGKLPPRWRTNKRQSVRYITTILVVALLIGGSIFYYMPLRIGGLKGLYRVSRSQLAPFQSPEAKKITPALVIVHPFQHWIEYGALLDLSSPMLDSPFVFTFSRGPLLDHAVADLFPERNVWHYYPETPNIFYSAPK